MRKKITFLSVLLVAALLLGMVPLGAFRSEAYAATADGDGTTATSFDVQGSKEAYPTKLDPENSETTVTLQLPAGTYKNKADIVFVMDSSNSIKNAGYQFDDSVTRLFDSIVRNNEGIELKIGVVKFTGYASDGISLASNNAYSGLVTYSKDETQKVILDAIKLYNDKATEVFQVPGSGSNMHSGLILANEMLSSDEDVDDSNKYVVLLTDGKSYIWNNSDNEPVQLYSQGFGKKAAIYTKGIPYYGQLTGNFNKENGMGLTVYRKVPYGDGTSPFVYPDFLYHNPANTETDSAYHSEYYSWVYNNKAIKAEAELPEDQSYVFPSYYSKYYDDGTIISDLGTPSSLKPANGSTVFKDFSIYRTYYDFTPKANSVWENLKYYSVNPYLLTDDGLFDVNKPNPDFFLLHADTLQMGVYIAGHYWKEEICSKYHTASILLPIASVVSGTGLHLAGSFNAWLREESDVSASINEEQNVANLFTSIDNSIRYMVSKGVVTDQITDDFTLKNADNADGFRMTLNGEELDVVFNNGVWGFGTLNEGIYPYAVSYDDSSKTITWEINVPVENVKPVTLSYDLIISENAETGEYDTNVSAILNYKSTDGKRDGTYPFPVPSVEYEAMGDYVIHHLDEDTGNPIADDVTGSAVIGSYVSGSAVTVTGYGFSKVDPKEGGTYITKVAADNVITFFYKVVEGNYLILHIDQDSDEVIREGSGKGQVGKYVTGAAITLHGYLVDLKDERTVSYLETLDEDESKNVMKFYYAPIYYELTYYSNYPNGESPKSATYSYRLKELPPEVKSPDDVEDPENGVFSVGKKWTSADGTEYDFTGWNTKPDGTGTSYQSPEKYQFNLNEETNPTNNNDNTDNNNQQGDAAGNAIVTTSSLRTGLVMAASSSSIGATGALYGQWKPVPTPPGGNGSGSPTKYTVTYQYTGDVPSGAPSVPASKTYAVGASVPAAKVPSMDGYTFSGWSGEVSTMPNHNVTVTGSWTADEPIDDPDTPLAPPTDDETDIDDPDTPLAPGTIDEETEIDDEETPLTPFTGDDRHTGLWAGISIASLAGIALLSKRRRKPAKH